MPWKCPSCGTINWHGAGCRLCSTAPEPDPESDPIFQVGKTASDQRETRAKLERERERHTWEQDDIDAPGTLSDAQRRMELLMRHLAKRADRPLPTGLQ